MSRSRFIEGGVGVAVIGSGTIGTLRAQILHRHPSVNFLGVCDVVEDKAKALGEACGADMWTTNAHELINRPEVDCVIVASTEDQHYDPAMAAILAGKHVLVEKPITILPDEAEKLLIAADEYNVFVYTGFTQRFRRRYLSIKESIEKGYIGDITSVKASIYLTQAVARAVISRAPTTTPSINTMTYLVDLLTWFSGKRPISAYASGAKGVFYEEFGALDSTWTVLNFDGGMVATLGASWEVPVFWPANNASMEFEVFGREGAVSVKDDHRDMVIASNKSMPGPYTPEVDMHVALFGSNMPGDWALGEHFGAMQEETHAFINSVGQRRQDSILATGRDGFDVLSISLAIDQSANTGEVVPITWTS
jgi:myo-inositol 2-dehydrogenase/D-chiro-inositol 1-dehydrogenase